MRYGYERQRWPRRLSFLRRTCSSRGISSSRHMDLGLPSISVCIMVIAWLVSERCLNGEQTGCECPAIPPTSFTKPKLDPCFKLGDTFRYTCIAGYVRKAGTSNLIRCKQFNGVAKWTTPTLECIPKPIIGTTQPPSLTATAPSFTRPDQMLRWSSTATVTEESKGISLTSPSQSTPDGHQENSKNEAVRPPSTLPSFEESNHKVTATVAALLSLVIVFTLIGLSIFCYKRRARSNMTQQTEEAEVVPMKSDSS